MLKLKTLKLSVTTIKIYFLILANILCIAEASFRTKQELDDSLRRSQTHPAIGASLILVEESSIAEGTNDQLAYISNAVYLGNGLAITHNHVPRPGKVWVVSPFLGGTQLSHNLQVTLETSGIGTINRFYTAKNTVFVGIPGNAMREVTSILTPEHLIIPTPEVEHFDAKGELPFVTDRAGYIATEAQKPLPILGDEARSRTGPDFCLLRFTTFDDNHPVAEIYDGPLLPEGVVITVLGSSLKMHTCDGSFSLLNSEINRLGSDRLTQLRNENSKKRKSAQRFGAMVNIVQVPNPFTCFLQRVRQIGDKLVADAVCWGVSVKEKVSANVLYRELFDPDRTNPGIQALTVAGLSGSGVYYNGQLIGIVSGGHADTVRESVISQHAEVVEKTETASDKYMKITKVKESLLTVLKEKRLTEIGDESSQKEVDLLKTIGRFEEGIALLNKELRLLERSIAESDYAARTLAKHLPSLVEYPILNISQIVTREAIRALIDAAQRDDAGPSAAGASSL